MATEALNKRGIFTLPSKRPTISIIIPTLNEAENITATLKSAHAGADVEIIVVDGGSSDGTAQLVRAFGVRLLCIAGGRAKRVNAGAREASGDVFLFLHGDTRLPERFDQHVLEVLANPGTVAGAFALGIDGSEIGLRAIEKLANFRSRFFQMPYGDQAIFLSSPLFTALGGVPDMPIMEDYVFVKRIKRKGRVAIAPVAVSTSSRRWLRMGILKTTLINQVILLAYFLGIDNDRLARWYRRSTSKAWLSHS
jgi:rSAM/selenodomain-associated transferase 2